MGERRVAPPPKPVQYVDPKAIVSITGSLLKSFSGKFKDFEIDADRADGYEDGSTKLYGDQITIHVRKGENRTFRVTAREARVSRDEKYFELIGQVGLEDSGGFGRDTVDVTV